MAAKADLRMEVYRLQVILEGTMQVHKVRDILRGCLGGDSLSQCTTIYELEMARNALHAKAVAVIGPRKLDALLNGKVG